MVERKITESDCFGNLEDDFGKEHASSGYEAGLELGKKVGQGEGFAQGLIEGEKKGSEVGFYKGCTMTYIQLLQASETLTTKSPKTLNKLNEVLVMVNNFPKTNETFCEEKLSEIRRKFKQSTSLLNLNFKT